MRSDVKQNNVQDHSLFNKEQSSCVQSFRNLLLSFTTTWLNKAAAFGRN